MTVIIGQLAWKDELPATADQVTVKT
jgi:hypothetical protein